MVRQPRLKLNRTARGFTLIELMVTVTVLAVLMSVAAPSFRQLLAAQRLRIASYDLIADLTLARSEALKRGASVQLVPPSGGWPNGWTVKTVSGEQTLGQRSPLNSITVSNTGTIPGSVTFDLNGRVANATSTVRIGLTDGHGRYRCIALDPSGRPKSNTTACPTT